MQLYYRFGYAGPQFSLGKAEPGWDRLFAGDRHRKFIGFSWQDPHADPAKLREQFKSAEFAEPIARLEAFSIGDEIGLRHFGGANDESFRQHLKAGGSALVLTTPQADNLAMALDDWGVRMCTDIVAVHEPIKAQNSRLTDVIEDVQRQPFMFLIHDYGDHPLAKPLKSLEGLISPLTVVETNPKAGYKTTPLLPVPQTLKTWGESNLEAALNEESVVEYNPPKGADRLGDLPPPLFAGAVVEKEDGNGRLVVIGSLQFAINTFINFPDLRFQRPVARFPGNAELFCNSVLWLSKMEPMLAISPAAMEVSRIREISPGALQFWRVGVLLIALPGMVILAGILMYFARRD
jgi:hypothetical protein